MFDQNLYFLSINLDLANISSFDQKISSFKKNSILDQKKYFRQKFLFLTKNQFSTKKFNFRPKSQFSTFDQKKNVENLTKN